MATVDEARDIRAWIEDENDTIDTGDLEPTVVLRMCNYILRKSKRPKDAAKSRRITDERKRAISVALAHSPNWPNDIEKECRAIEVLRAMLTEGER